jgi:multidrug efflux pump subunit AcrA (membrane-fusion protein)
MNSPNRVHPALPLEQRDNTVQFRAAAAQAQAAPMPRTGPSKLEQLVVLEAEIRRQPKNSILSLHAVNETRALVGFDQAFLFRLNRNQKPSLRVSSSVARVEMQAPLLRAIAADVAKLKDFEQTSLIDLKIAQRTEDYPFSKGFWSPFVDAKGKCFGGLLFVRSGAFTESDVVIAGRVGQTYAHAFRALTPPGLLRLISIPRWLLLLAPLVFLALFFIPVPMTSLAPFEVVAKDPAIVTAPIDGAISEIVAEPNSLVQTGDVLFRFDTTVLRAEAEIAQQHSLVAEAKLATAKNGAFSDIDAKRSMAELQAEVDLAHAERDFAQSLLERATVTAVSGGLLVYSSKSDWVGKPVRVGEKIMEVADATRVEYRADLAVHDSISLQPGGRVKLFLDADPLNPRTGDITERSYHATEKPGGILAYNVRIAPTGGGPIDRIGLRGTAQISGEEVSLGFYLFRRPIAALRQYFGL